MSIVRRVAATNVCLCSLQLVGLFSHCSNVSVCVRVAYALLCHSIEVVLLSMLITAVGHWQLLFYSDLVQFRRSYNWLFIHCCCHFSLTCRCTWLPALALQRQCAAIIMTALRSRCGHYIFVLWFLSSFLFLISAVADWISTIRWLGLPYALGPHGVVLVRI